MELLIIYKYTMIRIIHLKHEFYVKNVIPNITTTEQV